MMSKRPNIIITIMDDQRADALSCAGHPNLRTPYLDQLVRRGTRFSRAANAGANCDALCAPSRAMLHTGCGFWRMEGDGMQIPKDWPTLGERLQQADYHTHGVGKWHNDTDSYARSFTSGGEIFFGGMGDPWNLHLCHFDATGAYDCRVPVCTDPFAGDSIRMQLGDHIYPGRHVTEIFADAAIEFLDTYDGDEPFLLYTAFTAPHDPSLAPAKWHEAYKAEDIDVLPNWLPEHPFDIGVRNIRDELLAPYPRTEASIRKRLAGYYAMMAHADEQIGRIHEALRRRADADNTLIVHTGDHGIGLGAHGLMGKQNMYQDSLRIPLILAGPDIPAGVEEQRLCYGMDVHRTLLDAVGIETDTAQDSRSLMDDPRKELHFGYCDTQRAWTDGVWKVIEYRIANQQRHQLFHLEKDPLEMKDLSNDPACQDQLKHALNRLNAGWP